MIDASAAVHISGEFRVSPQRLYHAVAKCFGQLDVAPFEALAGQPALRLDSRRVETGDVFIARRGSVADGRDFIGQALAAGAGLVLAEAGGTVPTADSRIIVLEQLGARLGRLMQELAGFRQHCPANIAVTGTNGKSSTSHYIAALSEALGTSACVLGTLGAGRPGALFETGLTTPDVVTLAAVIQELDAQGIARVALEASSHALDQGRLDSVPIKVGVFTNLSRDHLDYHGSMLAYAAAKARLFQRPELSLAVINGDDPHARLMMAGLPESTRLILVGGEQADFRVIEWLPGSAGQQARLHTPEGEITLTLGLLGRFNLDNAVLAMAVLYGLGASVVEIANAATQLVSVPGRMERVAVAGAPLIVVDYAHTPDALENALGALKDHVKGQLWCVVGCGGDRDAGKRPMMAEVGGRLADTLVITDDNPRTESPAAIRAAMRSGAPANARVMEVDDRRHAIEQAIAKASEDDVILIAGKGHESYQEINGIRHDFSDLVIAREAAEKRATGVPLDD